MNKQQRALLTPFSLSAAIIVVDQISKALVVARVKPGSVAWSAFGDFFWLVLQYNRGMAFSLLDNLSPVLRALVLIALPLAFIVAVIVFYFRTDELTRFQRWALCGIVGGGIGTIIDRTFRPEGVVDFLSFKFYGIFGLARWPTFNVSDMSVVISVFLFAISLVIMEARHKREEKH